MAYVPLHLSGFPYNFVALGDAVLTNSTVTFNWNDGPEDVWSISMDDVGVPLNWRITVVSYVAELGQTSTAYFRGRLSGVDVSTVSNDAPDPALEFTPSPVFLSGCDELQYTPAESTESTAAEIYEYLIEVELAVPPEPQPGFYVYELEKGWSFDGNYIPHFVEMNWFFGDSPVVYTGIQKIRIHGLTKGNAYVQLECNGLETKYSRDGYQEAQYIDLLSEFDFVSSDFSPVTSYTDYSNRGLAIQMKFTGRNTNLTLPEPAHVIQVLVTQSTPSGQTAN